jgi:hypothetical protein
MMVINLKNLNVMKNYKILTMLFFTFIVAAFFLSACSDESIEPAIEGIAIENTDLLQVDDANPNITVSFAAKASDLNSVKVSVSKEGSSDVVYSNTLSKITSDKLNRVKINVPFPTPDLAPSGVYDVVFSLNGSDANTSTYKVNVLNNRTIKYCDFPAAPAGKVAVFVSVPGGADVTAAGKNIYITGNFETDNGGSDWSGGGNDKFKLTKISDQCYYIVLDKFDAKKLYKFTLGSWDLEFLDAKGNVPSNLEAPGGNVNVIVYNFKSLPVKQYEVPEVLPTAAIASGKVTAVVNINIADADDGEAKYYLVKKGATSLDGAIEMTRVAGTKKVAGAVPKENGAEYVIVKNEIAKVGTNNFDVEKVFAIDAALNPVQFNVPGFRSEMTVTAVPENLFIVGDATPGAWNNPVPVPSQQFTKKSSTEFELTIALTTGKSYLLLPVNGDWSHKFGGTGKTGGSILVDNDVPGSNTPAPDESGTYKINVNFATGAYTVTKV